MADEAQTLRELSQALSGLRSDVGDFRAEYRTDKAGWVSAERYLIEQGHMTSRLSALEAEQKRAREEFQSEQRRAREEALAEWTQIKGSIRTGIIGAVFAIVVALAVALIK
jgi:hypothetical protein